MLEYQVSVKVSWDFSMSLDSLGCKAFKKAGIQGFYSGASQNFTGVILTLGYHGWNSRFHPYYSAGGHSATAFGNTPQFRPYSSAGEQVTQYSQFSPGHSHTGPRQSVLKRRDLEK